ncbi:MAG: ferrous iron transport protein A [Anaerolineae bacterium]|nr:ferrous iron transport protein A [Anaerolineae bacterium]
MRHHRHHSPMMHHRPNQSTMTLSMVAPGETVELVQIKECARLRRRLADLGLNVGLPVRVVQNHHRGPIIVAVREDSRLAIGRGMAHNIRVCPCQDNGA